MKKDEVVLSNKTLTACVILGPSLQFIGDLFWTIGGYEYSWSIWRELSSVFFIPIMFAIRKGSRSSGYLSIICVALGVIGCVGVASMMPLFRLGAFYPIEGQYHFPLIVEKVLGEKLFAATLFPLGLCFPLSLLLFSVLYWRHTKKLLLVLLLASSGVTFWMGNALEIPFFLLAGDILLGATLFNFLLYYLSENFESQVPIK